MGTGLDRKPGSGSVAPSTQGTNAPVPGKQTLTEQLTFVQRSATSSSPRSVDGDTVQHAAALGVAGGGGPLPHAETIQRAFGRHDISGIEAHVGGDAATASRAIGADAYATGHKVAFSGAPSLRVAAHEAAHVVQQRAGVHLDGGVGKGGDVYEQHADAVADKVVRGENAEALLAEHAGDRIGQANVQRSEAPAVQANRPSAADLLDEALEVIETALAIATGEIRDDAAEAPRIASEASGNDSAGAATASGASRSRPDVVAHLHLALTELGALHGGAEDAIRAAVTPILRQVGAPSVADSSAPTATIAPVQRNTLVAGAPLLAGGPPGWVAYAVLGLASVGIMGYAIYQAAHSRARDRAEPRVLPRWIPRTTAPEHRGRIQVQGGGLELSFPWARPVPMTKVEGLAGLAFLKGQLSRGQLVERDEAFESAAKFISATVHTCPPDLARTFQNRAVRNRDSDERVDVEIRTGVAFV